MSQTNYALGLYFLPPKVSHKVTTPVAIQVIPTVFVHSAGTHSPACHRINTHAAAPAMAASFAYVSSRFSSSEKGEFIAAE